MAKVAVIKTQQNSASVDDFLNRIAEKEKREDSFRILRLMQKATKEVPIMWGSSMIGFGKMRYKSPATGREVDWFKMGFSPRKANLSLHLGLSMQKYEEALKKLGKHRTGVGCLYIKKLAEVDMNALESLINVAAAKRKN